MFKPSPSYPSVLEWTSQNDSGRVGCAVRHLAHIMEQQQEHLFQLEEQFPLMEMIKDRFIK